VIEFTPEETEQLSRRAHAHGYDNPADYVRALVALDEWEDDDETILAGLREGWRQALRDETVTWEEFVKAVQEDD
jgi:hypothetical protein